jgi:hypothetical protein
VVKGKNSAHSSAPHAAKGKSDRSTARAKEPDFAEVIGRGRSPSAQRDRLEVSASVWDQFRKDKQLRRFHSVSKAEMKMLSQAVVFGCDLGRIRSLGDLLFILNTIRHPVGR